MTKQRFILLALLVAMLAFVAAGCGGDDDEGGDAGGTTEETTTAEEESVSGSINVLAVWTGAEGEAFQAVLDGFTEANPDVNVSYQSGRRIRPPCSRPRSRAATRPTWRRCRRPGSWRDFAGRGALTPIDFARDTIEENYADVWLDLGSVEDELYGVFFKGANKSTVWYNVAEFEDAGIEPPRTGTTFLSNAETLRRPARPPTRSAARTAGRSPTCSRTSTCALPARTMYDQLATHEIPWTDQSVKDALAEMGKILGDTDNIAGGTSGALQADFPTSVTQVFSDPPKAAQVLEGDFVGGVIAAETQAEAETGFNVAGFPDIGDSDAAVVGGGDAMVMFKDNPAARRSIEYLATPEAAQIWAEQGGFSSPNQNLDRRVYPDEITRTTASALADAETFRFDLSDLQPAAFGSVARMFNLLQDFLRDPADVDGTAQALEDAAAKAFG